MSNTEPAFLGVVSGIGAAVSWAIGSTLIATLSGRAPAGALNTYKFVLAGVVLFVADLALNGASVLHPGAGAWQLIAVSALVGLGIGDNAYYRAIETLGVGRAMVFLATAPVFATGLGVLFLHERASTLSLAGAAITLAGVLLVVMKPRTRSPVGEALAAIEEARPITTPGVLFGVGAGVCQAVGSLFSRHAMNQGLSSFSSTWMRLAVAAAASLAFASARGRLGPWIRSIARRDVMPRMSIATVVGTIFGLAAAQGAIKYCASTGIASVLLATSPVFVLPLAHRFAGERLTSRAVMGASVAVCGVFVLAMAPH